MTNTEFLILDFIKDNLHSPIMDKFMVFVTTLGNSGAIWIITAVLMLCTKKYRKTGIMLALGLLLSLVIGNIILKPMIARERPFWINDNIKIIIDAPKDFSFPSGHTLASAISATILILRHRRIGICAAVLGVLIAFSRLYLYVHFPTDVLAGAVVGIIIGMISVKFVETVKNKKA